MTKALIEGSSKLFFPLNDETILMTFKDDIHGAQQVDTIEGTGSLRKEFTYYFYRILETYGIRTHLESSTNALRDNGIVVLQYEPVKIEILVRNIARGHWVDDHKIPLFNGGQKFDEPIVEFCLKMKEKRNDGSYIDDPRINPALAIALHKYAKHANIKDHMLLDHSEALQLETLALEINKIYQDFLQHEGWQLEDFKFEVGIIPETREFVLIDEISPDCSRIRDSQGNSLTKDLFRQRRTSKEIYQGYLKLKEAVKEQYYARNTKQN